MKIESGVQKRINKQLSDSVESLSIVITPSGEDDTQIINDAITKASLLVGNKRVILDGNFYVNTGTSFGGVGINMKSNVTLEFTLGSKVTQITGNQQGYYIIRCVDIENFQIINPHITGDRETNSQITGEWGHGISLVGCKNFKLINVYTEKCWGDGVNIGKSPITQNSCENFYIDKIETYKCRRNGVTFASGKNGIIDYIYSRETDGTNPKAALDIESNTTNEIWQNIKFGRVEGYLCPGGVDIHPEGMSAESFASDISIRIDEIILNGNDTSDTGNFTVWGGTAGKIFGTVDVGSLYANKSNRALYITDVLNDGIVLNIGNCKIITSNTGDTQSINNRCAIYAEVKTANRGSKNIGNVNINNLDVTGDAEYLLNAIGQNSGTYEKSNLVMVNSLNRINKPMRIDGNIYGISNTIINQCDATWLATNYAGQSWFTNQFYATLYHNELCLADYILSPSIALTLKETPIVLENRIGTYYFGVQWSSMTIHPASLSYTNGIKSNELGARIKLVQNSDGSITIIEKIGTWISV